MHHHGVSDGGPLPPLGADLGAGAKPAAVRLFVCVGKNCRCGAHGHDVPDALAAAIASQGAVQKIDVQPCGCLDHCEDGPIILAYGGGAARESRPPTGLGKMFRRPLARFRHVSPALAADLVADVLAKIP